MAAFSKPEAYERWMGRWSERLAPAFLRFAGVAEGSRLLDVGCGTGVLGRAVTDLFQQVEVVGIEPSAEYVNYARARFESERLSFRLGDAKEILLADNSLDGALALLILQEVPDAPAAIAEMARVTRPGGLVAACQWDFRDGMPMLTHFWDAVRAVNSDPRVHEEAARRTKLGYSNSRDLALLWSQAGLHAVATAELQVAMEFACFEDYWGPFLGGATPTSSYATTLPPAVQRALAEALRAKILGDGPDGAFTLPARAWAVRGTVPASQ